MGRKIVARRSRKKGKKGFEKNAPLEGDISNTALFVILILLIIASVASIVLFFTDDGSTGSWGSKGKAEVSSSGNGVVNIVIQPRPDEQDAQLQEVTTEREETP